MRKLQAICVALIMVGLTIKVLSWSVEPLLPYVVGALVMIVIYSWIFRRKW